MTIADVTVFSSPVAISELASDSVDGSGIFDTMMRSTRAHLEREFTAGRIKGSDYATVYLGAMEVTMKAAFDFIMLRTKSSLEQDLLRQQLYNAILQGKVLIAQECELRAQYDLLQAQVLKTNQEKLLLAQKTITEQAQTLSVAVDDNSVIGKQKILYQAQADGFKRDAEQKTAKLLVDSWSVRRTTDEGTVADGNNQLADSFVGRAVAKMLTGVGA
jgi:hypothetical protein